MGIGKSLDYRPDLRYSYKESNANLAVCIPAYNEPSLLATFNSLLACSSVEDVCVYVCFNCHSNSSAEIVAANRYAYCELEEWIRTEQPWFSVELLLFEKLPDKKAGVGLARKLCMDEAANSHPEAVLLALDADCTVSKNYLFGVAQYFEEHPKIQAASIYFEHSPPNNALLKEGIDLYELHLRYLKNALKWCGYPWYFHTVGSSMAVRATSYIKSGGMNTRQAGEDYYFLHKLMPLGFGEITEVTVFPEARYSDRVPFGTGRSMLGFQNTQEMGTYNFRIFEELRVFFQGIHNMANAAWEHWKGNCSTAMQHFWEQEGLAEAWLEAMRNSSNPDMAKKRFMQWFSGFRIIKCMHFLRDSGLEDTEIEVAAKTLLYAMELQPSDGLSETYRKLDRA